MSRYSLNIAMPVRRLQLQRIYNLNFNTSRDTVYRQVTFYITLTTVEIQLELLKKLQYSLNYGLLVSRLQLQPIYNLNFNTRRDTPYI